MSESVSVAEPGPAPTAPAGPDLRDVRLVATDLDGTLLRHGEPIAAATVAAVRGLLAAGVHVVPVTGRPLHWLDVLREELPEVNRVICANGAAVLNLAQDRVEWAARIEPATISAFALGLRDALPGATIGFETLTGSVIEQGFAPRTPRRTTLVTREQVTDPDSGALGDVIKILLKVPGRSDSAGLLAQAAPLLTGALHGTFSMPNSGLVELALDGITKAKTLERFAAALGVGRHQVVAFGDMPNDIEMLTWAGTGFAMTGGHPDALAVADALAPALDDGGIAGPLRAILQARTTRAAHTAGTADTAGTAHSARPAGTAHTAGTAQTTGTVHTAHTAKETP